MRKETRNEITASNKEGRDMTEYNLEVRLTLMLLLLISMYFNSPGSMKVKLIVIFIFIVASHLIALI